MNYQRLVIAGNAVSAPERKTSRKGDVAYTTFQVAVSDARDRTTYFPVAVFGQQAEIVASHVSKGCQVLVEGPIEVAENGRFNVVADHVVFGVAVAKSDEGEQ